jgi:2-amino-4-hydroxy-6-hydroxymethyldihydropteridine diphosphokinase
MNVGIGLGSNTGNRMENLRAAFSWLETISATPVLYSQVYETAPVGCTEPMPNFLNAVCEITYQGDLGVLLRKMRNFERERGRPVSYSRNTPRTLDLDLLYAGEMVLNTKELILPHPRMLERRFVLQPLGEIHPDLILPNSTQSIRDILASLQDTSEVKLFSEKLR